MSQNNQSAREARIDDAIAWTGAAIIGGVVCLPVGIVVGVVAGKKWADVKGNK